jgi:hypothetical protein
MNDDDDDALSKDFARRALNACCDSCGTVDWGIQEGEYALVTKVEGGSGVQVRAVICHGCGFVRLYSTLIGGGHGMPPTDSERTLG